MPYNGRLLARARDRLDEIKSKNAAEQARRLELAYLRAPRLRVIDEELRGGMLELMRLTISHSGDIRPELERIERENLALQEERGRLLVSAGFPADYTDEIYSCKLCHDSGMVGAAPCECLKRLYNAELTRELAPLLRQGDESFETFRLDYYGPPGSRNRELMGSVRDVCRAYAASFGRYSNSMLFQGGTGLGKTFLSACIAREVAGRGFSVAYESVGAALERFEEHKFSRDSELAEKAGEAVRQYMDCDLMILDDLGTEMTTNFAVAALYQLINGRLLRGAPTIISTNLSDEEIAARYGQQIASRLAGEYESLPFCGRDIRLIKQGRGGTDAARDN